ncbi:hypothetical protein [Candidatus Magnetaquiglobus chichijimensis]|uniref:hypothetical protein n=1 Tax=Candidatus Magnetaquiglobus chichijimensis TaxID=3141448 RepID=UPI003B9707FC
MWIYDDGYQLRVNEVVGDLTTFSLIGKSDQWVRRRGLLRESSNLGDMERRMVYRTGQPLESLRDLLQSKPGTAFSFHQEYRAGEQMIRQKVQVRLDAREQITVPAGKFDDALVLTWTTESLTSAWTSLERWWYVPEIGHYVRLEYKYGSGPFGSRVLIRHCAHDDKVCQKIYGR